MNPRKVPPIDTPKAKSDLGSALDFAIAAKTMPATPKSIGKKKTATDPNTMPRVEKEFGFVSKLLFPELG